MSLSTGWLSAGDVDRVLRRCRGTASRAAKGTRPPPEGVQIIEQSHAWGRGKMTRYRITFTTEEWRAKYMDGADVVELHETPQDSPPEPTEPGQSSGASAEPSTEPTVEQRVDGDDLHVEVKGRDVAADRTDVSPDGQSLVRNDEDLVRVAGVDLERWELSSWKANTWTTAMKVDTADVSPSGRPIQRPIVVRNWQVTATFKRRFASLVQPARGVSALPRQPRRVQPAARRALIVPDTQHGFRWSPNYQRLEPMHDRAAIDAVLQLARRLKPTEIVMLGDMLDLAPWSTKYARDPMLSQTTQPSLAECHAMLRSFREAVPTAEIQYHAGNHEDRIDRKLVQHADEALYLSAVGDDRTALDVARLLDLDSLGIEYCGPYGHDDRWLWDRLRVMHGTKAKAKSGQTVGAVIGDTDYDTIFGHVHRCEVASRTVTSPTGPRIITAATPGCLCRIDGAVPGATARPNWQQGCAVAALIDGQVHITVHAIHDGVMVYDGHVIRGESRDDEWAEVTGYPQSAAA